MSVIRVNKTRDYTVMSNHHFKDKSLSLKAKGLLSQMLSLPDDWDYTVEGLCLINRESKTSIQSALKELEEGRYLIRTRVQDELGRFSYEYDIYEQPQIDKPQTDLPQTENPYTDKPQTENQPQLNTKKSNTKNKKLNINNLIDNYTNDIELKEALLDFAEMRKAIKKPICTERAWKLLLGKLDGITSDTSLKIACLNQSIEHNWQSVYPLKQNGLKQQNEGRERLGWMDDIR